jgi:hypothetical protein
MSHTPDDPVCIVTCVLCNSPVKLETCKTDERGSAVHEECYVLKIRSTRAAANSDKRTVQLPGFLGHYCV